MAIDASGNLFVTDYANNRIRKVSLTGTITTVVGSGSCTLGTPGNAFGFGGDGGPATAAQIACPSGVAVDPSGNLYVSDSRNNRIRRVSTAGIITTVAGSGPANSGGSFSGDGGPATAAMLWGPTSVAIDALGNLYISDTGNNRVRKVSPSGIITTVAGSGTINASAGFSGDGGPATTAQLSFPFGVTVDASGNLLIADYANNRVREVSSGPAMTATGLVNAASGVGGAVAPGEFVTVYGSGLGPSAPVVSGGLALGLANTRVFFNGIEAFTTYVSSGQINAMVPYEIAGSSQATLQVEFQGLYGNQVLLPTASAVPGIFTLSASGLGPAVVVNQDGTFNSAANPASRGTIVSFWVTGQGQTNPSSIDGQQPQAPTFPTPVLPVSVSIGGIAVLQSDILFAGLVYAGVMQVNARVPSTVVPGNLVELLLVVGNSTSLQGVTLPAVTLSVR